MLEFAIQEVTKRCMRPFNVHCKACWAQGKPLGIQHLTSVINRMCSSSRTALKTPEERKPIAKRASKTPQQNQVQITALLRPVCVLILFCNGGSV